MLVLLGVYGLNQIGVVTSGTDTIVSRDLALLRQLTQFRDAEGAMQEKRSRAVTGFLLQRLDGTAPEADLAQAWQSDAARADALLAEILSTANRYAATGVSAQRVGGWQQVAQLLNQAALPLRQLREQTQAQFQAIRAGDQAAVVSAASAIAAQRADLGQMIDRTQEVLNSVITAGQQRSAQIYEESRFSVVLALIGSVVLGLVIALLIRRSIVNPLSAFMEFVERVGRGDLSGPPAATGRDELGQLGATLNEMVDGLRQLARQSRDATSDLNAAAAEIRASTQEQAASVEEQLAAVQETAATVDEITHSGTQIGKRAQEVIASAQATAQTSGAGLRAVDETVRAMDAIRDQAEAVATNIVALSEKTQAIGEIITTVNDISERSHLLALNAAIEAAAAGEQGRSFSVVAAEMKTLADQAKEATSQVRSILGDIQRGINSSVMLTEEAVKRVAAGRERTDTTHTTISEITARIQESVQTFQQIVASTNQQQLGIEQVMSALQNIRQASQQTAAGTRQLDMAAANLSQLSAQLVTLADRYRI
ncbi:methyl-accepting chemotaxis protein [Roseomonas marmotae]|uniref:Methyl-accepting chemotaxis protein n=2 Tax=Roseomonas marmotae TaxID=2768161 RepID=A0ABS3KB91_9PROT|nr:methyl-accepting chemotaxis protein [Roseomonas marmotae]QTI81015.1 methyl-accepting chemotaxis protein [Roseomonas marmotae]